MSIVLILLGSYISVCVSSNGETLKVIKGVTEKCVTLGGSLGGDQTDSISHATIKTEAGAYIIAGISECKQGAAVNVFINRGALYFNSVYAAENVIEH